MGLTDECVLECERFQAWESHERNCILEAAATRERLWLKRSPIEVQQQAAVDCQRVVRGYLARKIVRPSNCLSQHQLADTAVGLRRISELVHGLRHAEAVESLIRRKRRVDDATYTYLPPIAHTPVPTFEGTWQSWLQETRPDLLVDDRVERLLVSEVRSRARMIRESDMTRAEFVGHLHRRLAIIHGGSVRNVTGALRELRATGLPPSEAYAARGVVLPPLVMRCPPTNDRAVTCSSAATPRQLPPLMITSTGKSAVSPEPLSKAALGIALRQLGEEFVDGVTNNAVEVDLSNLNLSDAEIRQVLERVKHCDYVTTLLIGGNCIRDATCADVADALSHNPRIRRLSLAHTSISDIGASHLTYAVAMSKGLEIVDLEGTLVTEGTRSHIRGILTHRAQLRKDVREQTAAEEAAMLHKRLHPPPPESCLPTRRQAVTVELEDESDKRLKHLLALAAQRRAQQRPSAGSHLDQPTSPIRRAPSPTGRLGCL